MVKLNGEFIIFLYRIILMYILFYQYWGGGCYILYLKNDVFYKLNMQFKFFFQVIIFLLIFKRSVYIKDDICYGEIFVFYFNKFFSNL